MKSLPRNSFLKKVNIEIIKEIREKTNLSFNEIKKALEDANGDIEKTMEFLKERGAVIASKKSARETKQGVIESYVHSNKKVAAVVVLHCETDFVAKNEDFIELAHNIAMQVASMKPESKEELLGQEFIKDSELTIEELINQYIAKLGENINIGDFSRFEI